MNILITLFQLKAALQSRSSAKLSLLNYRQKGMLRYCPNRKFLFIILCKRETNLM